MLLIFHTYQYNFIRVKLISQFPSSHSRFKKSKKDFMRKYILVVSAIFCASFVNAQTRRTNQADASQTSNNSTTGARRTKLINGDVFLYTMKGKYKLYATYVNNKVVSYYAIDAKGNKLPASILTKPDNTSVRKLKCLTCVRVVDVVTGKSAEECEEIPCPDNITGEKATIKTAQK